jgi:hypothetical protein
MYVSRVLRNQSYDFEIYNYNTIVLVG